MEGNNKIKRRLEGEDESNAKKPKLLCVEEFRKNLTQNNLVASLKEFIKFAEQPEGKKIVLEYLEAGGSVEEILLKLDKTAKADLASALPVFQVLHLILLSVNDRDSQFYAAAESGVKFLFDSFHSTVQAMLNINSTKHRKVVLKLLASIVTLFPSFAKEIMGFIPNTPSVVSQFLRPQSSSHSVRKYFIFFILSFILNGDLILIQTIMGMKGLLGDIINDLKFDGVETVTVFLSVVKEKVLENVDVSKSLKLKVFNTQTVTSLFELFSWRGPKNINPETSQKKLGDSQHAENVELVSESAHSFLLVLCTCSKYGITFSDRSFGRSGELKNNLLLTVLKAIPDPWKNKKMSEVVIAIVAACPELMAVTLKKIEPVLDPRDTKNWYTLVGFVEDLLTAIRPKDILQTASVSSEIDLNRLATEICAPPILTQNLRAGIQKTVSRVVYCSMKILTLMWKNVEEILTAYENHKKLKNSLTSSFSKCCLEIDDILLVWNNICTSFKPIDKLDRQQFLDVVLDFLEMKSKCEKDVMDSPSRIAMNMLESLASTSDVDFIKVQSRIFYMLTAVEPMSITPDNDLFRTGITLLLENDSPSAIDSVTKILLSTGVFENNESEIDIWLACYYDGFDEYRSVVPNILAEILSQLYLQEIDVSEATVNSLEGKSYLKELMDIDNSAALENDWIITLSDSPTPILMKSLDHLKTLDKKNKKGMRSYLRRVAFRLFNYYNNSRALVKSCGNNNSEVLDPIVAYVEGSRAEFYASGHDVVTPAERELMSYITKRKKHLKLVGLLEDKSNFSLLLTFHSVASYFITLVEEDSLSDVDVSNFSKCFSFFINMRSEGSSKKVPPFILSHDVRDVALLRSKCIQSLFSIPLVDKFDVFERDSMTVVNFTRTMVAAILEMTRDDVKMFNVLQFWKRQFLHKIKSNIRGSNLEEFGNIESFMDRFNYTSKEVSDVLDVFGSIEDLNIFFNDGRLTLSAVILTKFAKLQCNFREISPEIMRLLWDIVKLMIEEKSVDFDRMDDCLTHILRKRPDSLSLIDTGHLEVFLRRSVCNENAVVLGKLLLSDPVKVEHFVSYVNKHFKSLKNKTLIVAMTSALVLDDDTFLELLRSRGLCCYWKKDEILDEGNVSEMSELVKTIYRKFKKHLFEIGPKEELKLNYSKLFSLLVKRFLEKEDFIAVKEEISEGFVLPEVIHDTIVKYKDVEDLTESYVKGLLAIASRKMTETDAGGCDESAWKRFSGYVEGVIGIGGDSKWKSIKNSSAWKDFLRSSLRVCFNAPHRPSHVKTIRCFVELFYKPGKNSRYVSDIFEMLISHSMFLTTMLHRHSSVKGELVKLYYSLIKRNSDVLSIKHIPLILASYSGSLSEVDTTLLDILRYYEEKDFSANEYEPLVWGDPAVDHYSVKSNVGVSLWRRVNMLNILQLLDPNRMELSLKHFPVDRGMKVDEGVISDDSVYDPAFLLPVFANLLSPGAVTYCLPFINKSCFAYTICSLSSKCEDVRTCGSVVLSRFYNHLELVQNMKMKSVCLHFINCLRYATHDIRKVPLPSIVTLFLARASLEISDEPGKMFTPIQNYILAKPVFTINCVPEFLPLFRSADVNYVTHRRWILEILRDGIKQNIDLDILFKTMAVKMILSYFSSRLCTRESKLLVLEVLTNALKVDKSKLLISEYGLLTWLNAVSVNCDRELFGPFVELAASATDITMRKLMNSSEKRDVSYLIQILNSLMKGLPNLRMSQSIGTLTSFLTIVLECLTAMLTLKHGAWCALNERNLKELGEITVEAIGSDVADGRFAKSKFFLIDSDDFGELERLHQKIVFLADILISSK